MKKTTKIILSILAFVLAAGGSYVAIGGDQMHLLPPRWSQYTWVGPASPAGIIAPALKEHMQKTGKYPASLEELCKVDTFAAVVEPSACDLEHCAAGIQLTIAGTSSGPTKIAVTDDGVFLRILPETQISPTQDRWDNDGVVFLADYSNKSAEEFAASPFADSDCDEFAVELGEKVFLYSRNAISEWQEYKAKASTYHKIQLSGLLCILVALSLALMAAFAKNSPQESAISLKRRSIAAFIVGLIAGIIVNHLTAFSCYAMYFPNWRNRTSAQTRLELLAKYHAEKKIDDVAYAKLKATLEKQLAATRPASSPTSKP